jgi:hypothetical protein
MFGTQHCIHLCGSLALGAHHDMRVEIGRDRDGAVAEDLLDSFRSRPWASSSEAQA